MRAGGALWCVRGDKQQGRILGRRLGYVDRVVVVARGLRNVGHCQGAPLDVGAAERRSPGDFRRARDVAVLVTGFVARVSRACCSRSSGEIAFNVGDAMVNNS